MKRFKQFERYIKGMARYSEINGYDYDDIYQELLMTLDYCVKSYDSSKATFGTYFINSCKNRIARLRKKNRYNFYYLNNDLVDEVIDKGETQDVGDIIEVLSNIEHGDLAIMNIYYGVPKIELARLEEVSQTTIANWVNKAVEEARNVLL